MLLKINDCLTPTTRPGGRVPVLVTIAFMSWSDTITRCQVIFNFHPICRSSDLPLYVPNGHDTFRFSQTFGCYQGHGDIACEITFEKLWLCENHIWGFNDFFSSFSYFRISS